MRAVVLLICLAAVLASLGCDSVSSSLSGKKCRHTETAEVLTEVKDARGDTWELQRRSLPGYKIDLCAVPVDAKLGEKKLSRGFEYNHPVEGVDIKGILFLPDDNGVTGWEWELGDPPEGWPAVGVSATHRGFHFLHEFAYQWY